MITGLYALWKKLRENNKTTLNFQEWKTNYFNKAKKRIKHQTKPRKKGLQKWM